MGPVSVCRIGAESADPSYLFGGEVPESDPGRAAWLGWLPLTLLDFAGRGLALAGDMWLAAPSRGLARGALCEAEHAAIRVSSDLRPGHTETIRAPGGRSGPPKRQRSSACSRSESAAFPYELRKHER